jgi:hypothetical protein
VLSVSGAADQPFEHANENEIRTTDPTDIMK